LNQFVDFHELQQGCHAIEGDLDETFYNSVATSSPKWRIFKFLRWMQNMNQSTRYHEIYTEIFKGPTTFNEAVLVKSEKYERGRRLNGKHFVFPFTEISHEPLNLDK
jgi:hypothetical protein